MIILIDNYDSFTYNLYQLLAQIDDVKVFRNDEFTMETLEALNATHMVVSPGPGVPGNAGNTVAAIKYFGNKDMPILGVCLGHQSIVEAFGGKLAYTEKPVHGKATAVFHHRGGIYKGMSLPFKAARYHSLCVEPADLPACLSIESENSSGMVMGIRHKTLPIFGVQFHPESILTPEGECLVRNFLSLGGYKNESTH